jgi:hypothetical protein
MAAGQTAPALKKPDQAAMVRVQKSVPELLQKGTVPELSIASL